MAIAQNWHTTKIFLIEPNIPRNRRPFSKTEVYLSKATRTTRLLVISFVWGRMYMSWVAEWPHTGRIYTFLICHSRVLRDLTIRQRRRQWKRRWKIAPASFQTISSTSYLKEGTLCWSWRERATPEFKQRWYNLSPCRSHLHVWSFHVAEQEMEKNVQKSVMYLLSLFSLSQVS